MKIAEIKSKNLPDTPGVYFFMGNEKKAGKKAVILYIGRATSIRDRVKSYFKDDVIHSRGAHIVDMVFQANDLDFIQADSVLEAVILEANLIKKYQPYYNTQEKDDKSFNYVIITQEDFPRIMVIRGKDLIEHFPKDELKYVFGPYPQGGILREGMKIIRRIFPYRDNRCIPAGTGKNKVGKPCFNRQIGLCPGVCTGEISKADYRRTVQNLRLFFEGKKHELIKNLERQMKAYAKLRQFEQANEVKKTIFALTHIQDISLIKEEGREEYQQQHQEVDEIGKSKRDQKILVPESAFRMEAYDIAHTSGTNMVGVMVVLEQHHIKKSDYRMFKVQGASRSTIAKGRNTGGDVGALKEVLDRRLNHPEWTYPNLIVMDGSTAQKNAAEELLKDRGFDIAVVAVVKNDRHRPDRILGDEKIRLKYAKEILLVNSEAHRFALKYHRKLRGRI